jgi:hypothetical protein
MEKILLLQTAMYRLALKQQLGAVTAIHTQFLGLAMAVLEAAEATTAQAVRERWGKATPEQMAAALDINQAVVAARGRLVL